MSKNEKVLVALVAGIAAGTLIGILFAPGKGSETRQKLAEAPGKLAERLEKELSRCKDKLATKESEPA